MSAAFSKSIKAAWLCRHGRFALLLAVSVTPLVHGQETPAEVLNRFNREARDAWKIVDSSDETLQKIKVNSRIVTRIGTKEREPQLKSAVVDRRPGHYLLWTRQADAERVFGGNAAYSFVIAKPPGKDGWVLQDAVKQRKHGSLDADPNVLINYIRPNAAAILEGTGTLAAMMEDETVNITRAELVHSKLVRVHFTKLMKKSKSSSQSVGWIELDPANSWAMGNLEYRMAHGVTFKVSKKFSPTGEGYRRCVSWEHTTIDGKEGFERTETAVFEALDEPPPSEGGFYLSAFGLPEPPGVSVPGSRWYLWFIGIAAVSLAIGAFFWRRASQGAKMPSANSLSAKPGA